jgi:TorA maturation chaperone TorD
MRLDIPGRPVKRTRALSMRDKGLDEAIRIAGGVGALARKIGISQSSISNWKCVPAERVLAVEAATGVDRGVLRPDLYGVQNSSVGDVDEVDAARAREYALLATLLARPPDQPLLDRLAALVSDDTEIGVAHAALAKAASQTTVERADREYFNLFVGIGRGELMPYGSYYQAGFLYERPLARLRADLSELGIERAEGQAEPEDHVAILCELMSGLVSGRLGGEHDAYQHLFYKHLSPWIEKFFADLECAEVAEFYRSVGTVGRVFVAIEKRALCMNS